jgi:DNA-binding phage protein
MNEKLQLRDGASISVSSLPDFDLTRYLGDRQAIDDDLAIVMAECDSALLAVTKDDLALARNKGAVAVADKASDSPP